VQKLKPRKRKVYLFNNHLDKNNLSVESSKPIKKGYNQKFLIFEQGRLINPARMNMAKLPKFFKKGIESNDNEEVTIQKTDRSAIVEKYKKMLEKTQKAPEVIESNKERLRQLKDKRKSKQENDKVDFSLNIFDAIKTVNDSLRPTYGVQVSGKGLSMADTSLQPIVQELGSEDVQQKITTTRDDETGKVKIKALPYNNNPKLNTSTTRQDYEESRVGNTFNKIMSTNISKVKNGLNNTMNVESRREKMDDLNMTSIK